MIKMQLITLTLVLFLTLSMQTFAAEGITSPTTELSFKLHNLTLQADSLIDNSQNNLSNSTIGSPFTPLIIEARIINPNHPETLYLEGLFSESMNKFEFAEGAFLQALYMAPAFERAYVRLISLYLKQNQLTKAQQMLRPLIDIAGPSLDTQFLMATLLYKKGQLQEALTILNNLETTNEITPHLLALRSQYKSMLEDCQKRLQQ